MDINNASCDDDDDDDDNQQLLRKLLCVCVFVWLNPELFEVHDVFIFLFTYLFMICISTDAL